ncbi:MAG: hypothetical protein APR53_03440 [Methanoculleus sp. SDB]|nr:MAG: hypothetical protein APR53_03440 [Methanoculleus sp. SDB]
MNVLVTGASGFTGQSMLRYLNGILPADAALIAHYRASPVPSGIPCTRLRANLRSAAETESMIRASEPDYILHLAGRTRGSRDDLFADNTLAAGNLIDAVRGAADSAVVLLVSSAAVYGNAGDLPVPETTHIAPVSTYGAAKAAEELLVYAEMERYGLRISIARPFNLCGPGQSGAFALGSVIRQAVAIERHEQETLQLANIDSRRDFIDVRDAVRAFWAIAAHTAFDSACRGVRFNVGSGASTSVREILQMIEAVAGRSYPVSAHPSPELIPAQTADITRICTVCRWKPEWTLERTMESMLAAERETPRTP